MDSLLTHLGLDHSNEDLQKLVKQMDNDGNCNIILVCYKNINYVDRKFFRGRRSFFQRIYTVKNYGTITSSL